VASWCVLKASASTVAIQDSSTSRRRVARDLENHNKTSVFFGSVSYRWDAKRQTKMEVHATKSCVSFGRNACLVETRASEKLLINEPCVVVPMGMCGGRGRQIAFILWWWSLAWRARTERQWLHPISMLQFWQQCT
jgi:hypothetical protein